MRKQNQIICWCFVFGLVFASTGCDSEPNNRPNVAKVETATAAPVPSPSKAVQLEIIIDVPKFANQSALELEKTLGKPKEVKVVNGNKQQPPGEYRLYNLPNHPQGLSVHFYGGKATIFNLVLGKAENSPVEALAKYFAIKVENTASVEKTRFLEKWQGEFNNVRFKSVYAMKEKVEKDDYKLLHAEVAR